MVFLRAFSPRPRFTMTLKTTISLPLRGPAVASNPGCLMIFLIFSGNWFSSLCLGLVVHPPQTILASLGSILLTLGLFPHLFLSSAQLLGPGLQQQEGTFLLLLFLHK